MMQAITKSGMSAPALHRIDDAHDVIEIGAKKTRSDDNKKYDYRFFHGAFASFWCSF